MLLPLLLEFFFILFSIFIREREREREFRENNTTEDKRTFVRAFCAFKKKKKRRRVITPSSCLFLLPLFFFFSQSTAAATRDAVSTLSGEDATAFSGRISQRNQALHKHFRFRRRQRKGKEGGEEGGGKKKNKQRDSAKDSEKIQRFLRAYEEKFRRHSLWRNCSPEEVEVGSFFIIHRHR